MKGNIADFIQEQSAAVSLLKLTHVVSVRIGESAFHMAEQFALEKRLGNGSGIDRHHKPVAAQTPGVDFSCQHVLSGTVLPGNQHSGIRRGYLFDCSSDSGHRFACSPVHSPGLFSVLSGISSHSLARLVPRSGEGREKLLVIPRLDDEIERAPLHSFHCQGDIGISRKEDNFHLRHHLLDLPGPVETFIAGVDVRIEIHIQQHHIGPEVLQGRDQRDRRRKSLNLLKMQGQQYLQRLTYAGVVVHNQYFAFPGSHNQMRI